MAENNVISVKTLDSVTVVTGIVKGDIAITAKKNLIDEIGGTKFLEKNNLKLYDAVAQERGSRMFDVVLIFIKRGEK